MLGDELLLWEMETTEKILQRIDNWGSWEAGKERHEKWETIDGGEIKCRPANERPKKTEVMR